MMIAQDISTEFDNNLTLQDKVRLLLNRFGSREIDITIDEIAQQLDHPRASVYQVINILQSRGEIETVKAPSESGPDKIVKLIVNKLEPSNRTYRRAADRSGRVERIKPALDSLVPAKDEMFLPMTVEYLKKKLVIEDMKERAKVAGLDESVITFEPDPQAEEAILILKSFTDLSEAYQELKDAHMQQGFSLEAEKRNVSELKRRLRIDTDKMLVGSNES